MFPGQQILLNGFWIVCFQNWSWICPPCCWSYHHLWLKLLFLFISSHLFEIQNSWNINKHIWIPSLLPCCWFFYVLLRLSFCFHSGSWSSSHQCLCTGRSEACGGRCLWTHQDVACQTPQSHASHVHHDTSKAALAKLAAKGTIYSGKFHGVYMCLLCLPQK